MWANLAIRLNEEHEQKMSKAVVFLAPGFEEIETCTIIDILRRCGVEVIVAGLGPNEIIGSHELRIIPDKSIDEVHIEDFDAVVCPGGYPGYENLRKDKRVLSLVKEAFNQNKLIAAICGAPSVLSEAGVLKGKTCTIYPGLEDKLKKGGGKPKKDIVVVDGNIITSQGPATAFVFSLKLAERLVGRETVDEVSKATLADIALR